MCRNKYLSKLFTVLIILISVNWLVAQIYPIPYHYQPYEIHSGTYNGLALTENQIQEMFSTVIEVKDAPWLRLYFKDVNLGKRSFIVIQALKDNSTQILNHRTIQEWNYTSAFFNGDKIRLNLFVGSGDRNVFFRLDKVMVGEYVQNVEGVESICGNEDNRVSSNDSAVGRIVPVGGTGWITDLGVHVTAGHVLAEPDCDVLEFNVPQSLSDGTIQHPDANHQYSINKNSFVYHNNSTGDDWGVFQVYDNPNTGLQPIEAQKKWYKVIQDNSPSTFRVTGFGVDGPPPGFGSYPPRNQYSQTQQTHSGPNRNSSGNTLKYVVDTQPGNSGSPVIDASRTGIALGVHTEGGCNYDGYNKGTSAYNTDFWNALHPIVNVLIDQRLEDGSSVDSVGRWENNQFKVYKVPNQIDFVIGSVEILRATQKILMNQKYNNWTGESDVKNHHEFEILNSTQEIVANLKVTKSGIIIRNELLSAPGQEGGTIEFKDPWLIDYPDPQYGHNKRNRGMDAPFKSRPSPFKPDYTTSYDGDGYQGVFLNQDPDETPVYYSVRAPLEQVIPFHNEEVTWYFQLQRERDGNLLGTEMLFKTTAI